MSRRLFFDSSALYAAVYSSSGAARELIRWSLQGKVQLVISQDVLDETQRNIAKKVPEMVEVYTFLVALLPYEIVPDPTTADVRGAERYVAQKDAPIIAAARKVRIDYLVTFDKKHLLRRPELAEYIGAKIITPGELVALLRLTE